MPLEVFVADVAERESRLDQIGFIGRRGRCLPLSDPPPKPAPKNVQRATFFQMDGSSGRTLTYAAFG